MSRTPALGSLIKYLLIIFSYVIVILVLTIAHKPIRVSLGGNFKRAGSIRNAADNAVPRIKTENFA